MIPMFEEYQNTYKIESANEIKPGLEAIQVAMEKLGNPQLAVPTIHVAGTNGKGSTIRMIERIAQEHGLTTATFMSPCIENVHDQIRLNGQSITPEQMNRAFEEAKKAGLSGLLTEFELLTAIAFIAIRQAKPDLAMIESGMGGRFDSTNVVEPIVSVIPSIALEHTNFLGDTLEKIAWHKAGIIKKNGHAVIGEMPETAQKVIEEEAYMQQATIKINGKDFKVLDDTWSNEAICISGLHPSLKGEHQKGNMALAIQAFIEVATVLHIELVEDRVQQAVATTNLEGRFEQLASHVWLDGAHNPASAKSLRKTIQQVLKGEKVTMVVGILKDKDVEAVLRELEQVSDDFIFVAVEREQDRLMQPEELMKLSHAKHKQIASSVLQAVQEKQKEGSVVVTGSLYLLAQWRSILQQVLE